MGVITRSSILREVLEEKDRQMYRYSNYGAGLTAREGYEQLFEDLKQQREMLREMEAGRPTYRPGQEKPIELDPLEYMLQGNPLMTPETIEAARRMDEARDKIIEQIDRPEPDVPKVVELKEWQRINRPPERLDFDEDS